jgi:chromosome segregation ATPase
MNNFYIARTILALSFCSTILSTPARAEDPRFLSSYHSEYGLKLLNESKYDLAVERFARAFLLDPQSKTAKESLQKIAGEQSYSGSKGLKILRFIDQVEYIDFLTSRYQGLVEENGRLLQYLQDNQNLAKDTALLEKFNAVEGQIKAKPSALPRVGLIGFAGDEAKSMDLNALISQLAQERTDLAKEVGFWEDQNNQLRSLRKTVLFANSAENPAVAAEKYKSQLDEVADRVKDKDELLSVQQQNIEYFKTELAAVRSDFTSLQDKFKNTDVKISELTNKIAGMSAEIFEKNKIIIEKEDLAASLQKDLGVANEKINLVQRIIQEKDDRISALEKEMATVQTSAASTGHPADSQVLKVQSDLKDFEVQFKEQMEKSRERIVSLEVQYADLTTKYEALLQDTQAKDAQVAALKNTVTQKNVLANQYKDAFLQTDEKANQLIGMIEIYRGKLSEVKQHLSSKEDELRQLQGVLFDLNTITPASQSKADENEQSAPTHIEVAPNSSYDLTLSKPGTTKNRLQER